MTGRIVKEVCEYEGVEPSTDRVGRMRDAHHALQRQVDKLHHAQWAMNAVLLEIAAKAIGMDEVENEPGYHECENEKNPIGECVYDSHEDPAWDDCLFCHQPWERK